MTKLFIDTQKLSKYKIFATDGELGKINDFYFDEDNFFLRYFVIDTNKSIFKNLVLISPISLKEIDFENKVIHLSITKSQAEKAPFPESVETISEQFERDYNSFFGWPNYWEADPLSAWSVRPYSMAWYYKKGKDMVPDLSEGHQSPTSGQSTRREKSNLRSASVVESYQIQGDDGIFGHVQGYLVNSKTMAIEFFIIDTIKNFPSKLVLIRPDWIKTISWFDNTVAFPFTEDLIKSAPSYHEELDQNSLLESVEEHYRPQLNRIKIQKSHEYPLSHRREML